MESQFYHISAKESLCIQITLLADDANACYLDNYSLCEDLIIARTSLALDLALALALALTSPILPL